ncbi:hypothetical protein JB92DRAFT_2740590 [Gautieria morchelliformis]|nr:hypothetical protein JB92DRAFT_2740590 [Gautieria morchelliformis]
MEAWKLKVSTQWDVLGPFPISAREQHFLSPSYPVDLSSPYQHEPNRTWFSSLADGGKVGWKSFNATQSGRLLVSHPHIRWKSLRAAEGWAAFQHHNVLRTTLEIIPPTKINQETRIPLLALSLQHVSFFALVPVQSNFTDTSFTPEWHPGNIYGLPRPPKHLIEPAGLASTTPTTYNLFVSGDYEIRLFGDPEAGSHQEPELDVNVSITLEPRQEQVTLDPALHVVCDFLEGWAFGTALGIGVLAVEGTWEVIKALQFSLALLQRQRLAPSQTRVVPITIKQLTAFHEPTLQLCITLVSSQDSSQATLTPRLDIRHWSGWEDVARYHAIQATYFLADTAAPYLAIPPLLPNHGPAKPPILALHGAGVDISDPFWAMSLPRQPHSWIICPIGRTSWGFDWHGPSASDAWGSLAALIRLLTTKDQWAEWKISDSSRVVIMGHSNGGQGTWYLASRYPDRVLAAIPAAAYIKSQQYVPLSFSRGSHFIDPASTAILAASLAPDDNDLFLSNVVSTSILAVHGGEDENVPTWHSRELVGLVKTLQSDANISMSSYISFIEEPGAPHWYPNVLNSPNVQTFLSAALEDESRPPAWANQLTLTVAIPSESGSFHGFTIRELEIPGRLARLHVSRSESLVTIRTTNVHTFSIDNSIQVDEFSIDGTTLPLPSASWVQRTEAGWRVLSHPPLIRPMGPISRILCSSSRLLIIIPSVDQHAQSIARRLAHSMLLNFRLDAEIITDMEALDKGKVYLGTGDLIVIGSNNKFGNHILHSGPGIVKIYPKEFIVHGKTFAESSLALVFLHPHPSSPDRLILFLCANGGNGLERAARLLLPIRTGVPLPEFLIIGGEADTWGVGGLRGGGFWSRTWSWNEAMAWID